MNPYKEDGPCARLSFDRAYCKRCTAPPSVNDGYITGTERRTGAADGRKPAGCPRVRQRAATPAACRPACGPVWARRRETLSARLKLSFGSAATGPL